MNELPTAFMLANPCTTCGTTNWEWIDDATHECESCWCQRRIREEQPYCEV